MYLSNQKNLVAGTIFVIVGMAFAMIGQRYAIGTAADMGAGYFPVTLGVLLAIIGGVVVVKAFSLDSGAARIRLPPFDWVATAIIIASIVFFAVMLTRIGLVLTTIGAVLISRLAGKPVFNLNAVVTALCLAAFTVAVFRVALNLQLPVWPSFD